MRQYFPLFADWENIMATLLLTSFFVSVARLVALLSLKLGTNGSIPSDLKTIL